MENYYEFVELPCRDIKGKGPTSTYLLKVGEWLRALETVNNNGPSIMGKKKVDEVLSFPIQGTLAANNIQMSGGEARPRHVGQASNVGAASQLPLEFRSPYSMPEGRLSRIPSGDSLSSTPHSIFSNARNEQQQQQQQQQYGPVVSDPMQQQLRMMQQQMAQMQQQMAQMQFPATRGGPQGSPHGAYPYHYHYQPAP